MTGISMPLIFIIQEVSILEYIVYSVSFLFKGLSPLSSSKTIFLSLISL